MKLVDDEFVNFEPFDFCAANREPAYCDCTQGNSANRKGAGCQSSDRLRSHRQRANTYWRKID
jgi:hypothetical protein